MTTVVLATFWILLVAGDVVRQQRPAAQDDVVMITDYEGAPRTLVRASSSAVIVARIRVGQSRVRPVPVTPSIEVPVTEHVADVLEVFKGIDLEPTVGLRIVQERATRVGPRNEVRLDPGVSLRAGQEYVVFLERPQNGVTVVQWHFCAFHLDGKQVRIPVGSRHLWDGRSDVPRDEFMAALRRVDRETRR